MSYAKHLFISYSHIDDKPLSDHQQGWITRFHNGLSAMLSVRLGKEVSIWRDNKLSGNDIFADEILAQFPSTELMVSIISPRYVQSEWCTREAKEFCKAAEQTGGVVVGNKARVIKVIKLPAECEDLLPEVLRQELGYPFYFLDENQVPIELDPAYGDEFAQKYNRKLATLSHDIAQFIKKLEADSSTTAGAPNNSPKPRIYLAECSYDRRDDRESIATGLRLQGYDVYPDKPLPREEDAYVKEVKQLLARCELSIHLFGSKCGFIPSYRIVNGDRFRLAPVLEFVGWNVTGGLQTPPTRSTNGSNILNIKVGARMSFAGHNSVYVGYGTPLTSADWYKNFVRVELRHAF